MTDTNEIAANDPRELTSEEFISHLSGGVYALANQIILLANSDPHLRGAISIAAHHIISAMIHAVGNGHRLGQHEASALAVKQIAEQIQGQADTTMLAHWEPVAAQIRASAEEINMHTRLWRPSL